MSPLVFEEAQPRDPLIFLDESLSQIRHESVEKIYPYSQSAAG
jgi:hypothetical protein